MQEQESRQPSSRRSSFSQYALGEMWLNERGKEKMRALKILIYGILVIVAISLIMAIVKYTSPTPSQDSRKNTNTVEIELKAMAIRFINAEYQGNISQLLDMSKSDAYMSIAAEKHVLPIGHKLEKILSCNVLNNGSDDTWEVIVAIGDSTLDGEIQPTYYEHLWFKKIENNWYVVKIERDA